MILSHSQILILTSVVCEIESKCWIWKKTVNDNGYGVLNNIGYKNKRAHRVSYEVFVGPIKDKMQINHICKNRSCVNPEHLEQLTHAENGSRDKAKHHNSFKTHCIRGHEYNQENTVLTMRESGHNGWVLRSCKACRKITSKRYRDGLSPKRPGLEERFMSKVKKQDGGCWEWQASTFNRYGKFRYKGQMRLAHRVSYKIFKGNFDESMVIDHMCCNRTCVNPDHLQVLTREENSRIGNKNKIGGRKELYVN